MGNGLQKWLTPGAILLSTLIILGGIFFTAKQNSYKLAQVDMEKIVKDSKLAEKYRNELQDKSRELKVKQDTAKDDQEKQLIAYEFEKFKAEKEKEVYSKVKEITAKIAKQKGFKAVTNPQVFLYNEYDLTNEVIKELDK